MSLPKNNPYDEIYRIKGTGSEVLHTDRKYWGLVDPDLLNPGNNLPPENLDKDDPDALDASSQLSSWEQYLELLKSAEKFHNLLEKKVHPSTYTFHGTNYTTAEEIIMETETVWVEWDPYPKRGFRGRFTNSEGDSRRAILQDPAGTGDGTVPISSASSLDELAQSPPAPLGTPGEHEPIYKSEASHDFVVRTISTLCKDFYVNMTGKEIQ